MIQTRIRYIVGSKPDSVTQSSNFCDFRHYSLGNAATETDHNYFQKFLLLVIVIVFLSI